jgi:hypothetical protein
LKKDTWKTQKGIGRRPKKILHETFFVSLSPILTSTKDVIASNERQLDMKTMKEHKAKREKNSLLEPLLR